MTTPQHLEQLNRWLIIATVATALLYCGYFVYHEVSHGSSGNCHGSPCWNPEQEK